HVLSAIDRQRRTGDETRIIRGEKDYRARDLLRFTDAINRYLRQDGFLEHVLRNRLHHFGVDIAGADHVDGDAALGVLQRERLCETDVAGLRRRIVHLTEL